MNLMELFVKLSLDSSDFQSGLDKVTGVAKTGALAIGGAIVSAGTAITALAKKSADAYADYEQLVGGVETLFGAQGMSLQEYADSVGKTASQASQSYKQLLNAQSTVFANAEQAYKTAGLSANEYMEQATSFSASLIQSLSGDTVKASEYTNRAIVDMADNANKMGTSMEAIQNAYNGFSKQNYTMLDNLKLGYGGTKEEMERLIKDASKLTSVQKELGVSVDANDMSFGNIVNAISVMQSKMGIAGTTAKEASTTIQGSANMMKSAWENLVAGFSKDEANISKLMGDVFESANTYLSNLLPRIVEALKGISTGLSESLPKMFENGFGGLSDLFSTIAPQLITTVVSLATSVVKTIASKLPSMIKSLGKTLSNLLPTLFSGFGDIFSVLMQVLPDLTSLGAELLEEVGNGIANSLPKFLESALSVLLEFSENLRQNLGTFADAGMELLLQIAMGIAKSLPILIEYIPQIITNIAGIINDNAPKLLETGVQILLVLGQGILDAIPTLLENIPQIFEAIVAVWSALNWIDMGKNLIAWIKNGVENLKNDIPTALKNIADSAKSRFQNVNWKDLGINLVKGIWNGIKSMSNWLINMIGGFANDVLNSIKGFFGIHSPSTETEYDGKMIDYGFANGIVKNTSKVISSAKQLSKNLLNTFDDEMKEVKLTPSIVAPDFSNLGTTTVQQTGNKGSDYSTGNFNQTININQQIDTADELARAIRIESKYGLMRGVEIG